MLASPFVVAGVGYAVAESGPAAPMVSVAAPAGYQPIADAYFGYAIPRPWRENDSATTTTGTYFYTGPSGWVGEVLAERATAPALGAAGPRALGTFAERVATPFSLTGGRPVTVPGATVAYAYTLVRDGRPTARVVDAWAAAERSEIWLAVAADPATAATVVGSLRA